MARVGGERDRDLAAPGVTQALGAEVVLDVAGSALDIGRDDLDRPLAFELAQDLLVRHADRVREDVEPAAVRHADHDLVGTGRGGKLERLVEHRDQHVEALERELLLAEERAAQVALHPLDLAEARVEPALLVRAERRPEAPRLDRLAQPDALLVVADVLHLVAKRPAVGLREPRQRLGKRLALDVDPQDGGRDPRLQLGRQLRLEPKRVECRVADRLRAERVEARGEVAVHPVGLDERHRGRDAAEQLGVDRRHRRGLGDRRLRRTRRRLGNSRSDRQSRDRCELGGRAVARDARRLPG